MQCPSCKAPVENAAGLCRKCGRELPNAGIENVASTAAEPRTPNTMMLIAAAVVGIVAVGSLMYQGNVNSASTPVVVKYVVTGRLDRPLVHPYVHKAAITHATPGGGTQQVGSV